MSEEQMNSPYCKSIFEKEGRFKFLLFEQREDRLPTLCESVESPSIFDMSCTPIWVNHSCNRDTLTELDYIAQRDRIERDGWTFLGEAFDELPIGVDAQKLVR